MFTKKNSKQTHANLNKYKVGNSLDVIIGLNLYRLNELKFHPGKRGSCNLHLIMITVV